MKDCAKESSSTKRWRRISRKQGRRPAPSRRGLSACPWDLCSQQGAGNWRMVWGAFFRDADLKCHKLVECVSWRQSWFCGRGPEWIWWAGGNMTKKADVDCRLRRPRVLKRRCHFLQTQKSSEEWQIKLSHHCPTRKVTWSYPDGSQLSLSDVRLCAVLGKRTAVPSSTDNNIDKVTDNDDRANTRTQVLTWSLCFRCGNFEFNLCFSGMLFCEIPSPQAATINSPVEILLFFLQGRIFADMIDRWWLPRHKSFYVW